VLLSGRRQPAAHARPREIESLGLKPSHGAEMHAGTSSPRRRSSDSETRAARDDIDTTGELIQGAYKAVRLPKRLENDSLSARPVMASASAGVRRSTTDVRVRKTQASRSSSPNTSVLMYSNSSN
jgi:hypothetical protein